MRLSADQVNAIRKVITHEVNLRPLTAYLYGSRTDDSLKGGDIDLVVVSEIDWPNDEASKVYRVLGLIKSTPEIQDRKINLSFISRSELESDPFWQSTKTLLPLFTLTKG